MTIYTTIYTLIEAGEPYVQEDHYEDDTIVARYYLTDATIVAAFRAEGGNDGRARLVGPGGAPERA